jgi:hypothetical protein
LQDGKENLVLTFLPLREEMAESMSYNNNKKETPSYINLNKVYT